MNERTGDIDEYRKWLKQQVETLQQQIDAEKKEKYKSLLKDIGNKNLTPVQRANAYEELKQVNNMAVRGCEIKHKRNRHEMRKLMAERRKKK